MEQRSPEWFAARKGRVTGSMVGAILGLDPNTSRAEAMRRMRGQSEFKGNIATEWGKMHEQEAKEDFEYVKNIPVFPASFVIHPTLDWLGASPDGYLGDDTLIEIKCPYGLRNGGNFKTIDEQPHYYAQMQIQMYCTGTEKCFFWQWTPHDNNLTIVDRDQVWIDENLPKLEAFYQEYLEEQPDLNTSAMRQKLAEYDDLANTIKDAEERRKEILADLVKAAGEKDAVICGRKLTKVEKAGSISYASAIKELAPNADLEKWRGKPSSYWLFK